MRDVLRPWTAEQPLSELTLFADWDGVASMIAALRAYWFDHGTIPVWNYMLCGGRPELALPFSWAWTWPSALAYLLPPVPAILAVWALMTGVGLLGARALFARWSGDRTGAWVGAIVYAFGGHFAARFNAGHVTFAFYHLLPVAMLLFEIGFERALAGRPAVRIDALALAVAFLFFTAGLPHGLMHFYPAFLLLVVFRVAAGARERGCRIALRAARGPLAVQVLGLWLATYKIWPAVRWQLEFPRHGVFFESYTLLEVLWNTLLFVPDYFVPFAHGPKQAWHVLPAWGYNAFVGPLPWLLAAVALLGAARRRAAFAATLVAIGWLLSLGNDSPLSPAYTFRFFPLLDGIRAFNRYQILVVFGLAALTALAFASLSGRKVTVRLLVLATAVPVLAQSGFLVWNLSAAPRAAVVARYDSAPVTGPPRLVYVFRLRSRYRIGSQTALIERGDWIANCRVQNTMALPDLPLQTRAGTQLAISQPAPVALVDLTRDRLTLRYPNGAGGPIHINLRKPAGFESEGHLSVRVTYPGPAEGAWISVAGLFASVAFLAWSSRAPDQATTFG